MLSGKPGADSRHCAHSRVHTVTVTRGAHDDNKIISRKAKEPVGNILREKLLPSDNAKRNEQKKNPDIATLCVTLKTRVQINTFTKHPLVTESKHNHEGKQSLKVQLLAKSDRD